MDLSSKKEVIGGSTELSLELQKLSDMEKKHYFALEDLFLFSIGEQKNVEKLCAGLKETVDDWKKMMGGRSALENHIAPYLYRIMLNDRDNARNLYFFLSPIFLYIHVLYELSRKEWRNAVSWSGMFCERIVRNLLKEIDRRESTDVFQKVEKSSFENKAGKLKSELENRGFKLANELYSLMGVIYSLRDTRGPHDVPPPERIRAQTCSSQCLPVYIDYLEVLMFLGNDLKDDYHKFVSFFSNLTETKISLTFGEEEKRVTVNYLLKNVLYREGFFRQGKKHGEVMEKLRTMGYNFGDSQVSKALSDLSKGKDAIFTKKGKRRNYVYEERYPPNEFFKSII
jgi:hypothetical protein